MCRCDDLRCYQTGQPEAGADYRDQRSWSTWALGCADGKGYGEKPSTLHLTCRPANELQGLKVVGIDARDQPLESALKSHLPPDIALNARDISIEEAQEQVAKLRPDDYVGWPGVDGIFPSV